MGPFSDDATLVWLLLGLLVLIGIVLVRLSRQQPFPEPSFRYGSTLLVVGALLAMGTAARGRLVSTGCWRCCACWEPLGCLRD